MKDGEVVRLGGIMSKARITTTRKTGEKMAIVGLEDLTGTVETLVFPRTFQKYSNLFDFWSIFVKRIKKCCKSASYNVRI